MDCKELKINIKRVKQNDVAGIFCNKSHTSDLEIYPLFSVKNIYLHIFCLQIFSESATWVFSCKKNMLATRGDQ